MFDGAEGNSVCRGKEGTGGGPAISEGGKERGGGSRTCGGLHTQASIRFPVGQTCGWSRIRARRGGELLTNSGGGGGVYVTR